MTGPKDRRSTVGEPVTAGAQSNALNAMSSRALGATVSNKTSDPLEPFVTQVIVPALVARFLRQEEQLSGAEPPAADAPDETATTPSSDGMEPPRCPCGGFNG